MTDATFVHVIWALVLGGISAASLPRGSLVGLNVRCNVLRLRDDDGALGRAIAERRLVVRGAVHDLVSGELRPVEDATGMRG